MSIIKIQYLSFLVLVFSSLFSNLFSNLATAAEEKSIRIGTANSAYNDILAKVQPHFEKAEGIKLVYIHDTSKPFEPHLSMDAVVNGKADIGVLGSFYEDWVKAAKDKFPNLDTSKITSRVIGKNASFIVTAKAAGVKKLTPEQFAKAFSGEAKNWKELGGKDAPIYPYLHNGLKGLWTTFQKRNMKGKAFSPAVKFIDDYEESAKIMAANPGAVTLYPESKINPTEMTVVETEEIFRPVILITQGKPSDNVNKLLAFIAGDGKKYLKK